MRPTIGAKVFGIAVGLLLLMGAAALLSLRMTRTVDDQLGVIDDNYFPAYAALAQAHIRTVEEAAAIRRLLAALAGPGRDDAAIADLEQRIAAAAEAGDGDLAEARRQINAQINDALDFDDNVALARLDTRLEHLQGARQDYEARLARLVAAARERGAEVPGLLAALDRGQDDFARRIDAARDEMRRIADGAIQGTRAYQRRAVELGLSLLVLAALLGLGVAAAVTRGLVRPVRRLLAGAAAVEGGALDTVVPVTSRDEIGGLTRAFNAMVGELRAKAQIRETFGKYIDPRIVAGLIDRPDLTDPKGARREMTILFCDMQGFTAFSEGMTPPTLVAVLNRYLAVLSEAVRRNGGIVDKYVGDGVMAFWGPPFTAAEDQGRLAASAALEMLAALPGFQAELPDLVGVRRGLPEVRLRIGIATGDVVIGNIGSEDARNYTVIGDTVNLASRLEGACKAYGCATLIDAATRRRAGAAVEVRELDRLRVVGKSEPEQVFEILGRAGEVPAERLRLRDRFAAALAAYRAQAWDEARAGFEACRAIAPDDPPSRTFLARVAHFAETPPSPDWDGVWSLTAK
jgi:adenylate cyclase